MKSTYFFKIKPKTNTRKVCNKKKKLLHSFILKKEFSKKKCMYVPVFTAKMTTRPSLC